MKLDDYLIEIDKCPDEYVRISGRNVHRLTSDFGISDNWPIFIAADYNTILKYYQDKYSAPSDSIDRLNRKIIHVSDYIDMVAFDYVPLLMATDALTKNSAMHHNKQKKNYNMGIVLYSREINDTGLETQLALLIKQFGLHAIENKIPLCFPYSIGWAKPDDYSQIVYFP